MRTSAAFKCESGFGDLSLSGCKNTQKALITEKTALFNF